MPGEHLVRRRRRQAERVAGQRQHDEDLGERGDQQQDRRRDREHRDRRSGSPTVLGLVAADGDVHPAVVPPGPPAPGAVGAVGPRRPGRPAAPRRLPASAAASSQSSRRDARTGRRRAGGGAVAGAGRRGHGRRTVRSRSSCTTVVPGAAVEHRAGQRAGPAAGDERPAADRELGGLAVGDPGAGGAAAAIAVSRSSSSTSASRVTCSSVAPTTSTPAGDAEHGDAARAAHALAGDDLDDAGALPPMPRFLATRLANSSTPPTKPRHSTRRMIIQRHAAAAPYSCVGHDLADPQPEVLVHDDDLAAGDQGAVDQQVGRGAGGAVELDDLAGVEGEQLGHRHPGPADLDGDLHGHVAEQVQAAAALRAAGAGSPAAPASPRSRRCRSAARRGRRPCRAARPARGRRPRPARRRPAPGPARPRPPPARGAARWRRPSGRPGSWSAR